MPNRFTDNSRYSRARKISDKKLSNYTKISSDPVIVYSEIVGSGSTPYKVLIDLKKREVTHDCPDIRKKLGYWCKHLVKILLTLDPREVNEIYRTIGPRSNVNYSTSQLTEIVKSHEIEKMSNQKQIDLDDDMTLSDLLTLANQLSKKKIPENLIERIVDDIEKEIHGLDPLRKIINLSQLLHNLDEITVRRLNHKADNRLSDLAIEGLKYVLDRFFVTNVMIKINVCYRLRQLISKFNIKLQDDWFDIPLDHVEEDEKKELAVILELLIKSKTSYSRILKQLRLESKDLLVQRRRIANVIRIRETSNRELRIWAEVNLPAKEWNLSNSKDIDDFLIYCINSVGLQPRLNISFKNQMQIAVLDKSVIEKKDAIYFAISRIIEDNRDYITYDEGKFHSKLIGFLKGENVNSSWRETIREYPNDSVLPKDGVIIQWDVTGKLHHSEFLHAENHEGRILLDPNSPVAIDIQPFDFTICRPGLKIVDQSVKMAYAEYILSFDQVRNYVKQGIQIVSAVLPLHILEDYHFGRQVVNADILLAKERVKKLLFVFGSTDYLSFLEEIENVGTEGASPTFYQEVYNFIKSDTGHLNKRSRPVIHKLIIAESNLLDPIFDAIGADNRKRMTMAIYAVRKSPTLEDFRSNISKKIAEHMFKNEINNTVIVKLEDMKSNQYIQLIDSMIQKTEEFLNKLYKRIQREKVNKSYLKGHSIGLAIANEASISGDGYMNEDEEIGVEIVIERFLEQIEEAK